MVRLRVARRLELKMAKILIADDDPYIREMLRSGLEMRGAKVCEATDGDSAIRLVQEAKPDVVVIDVVMPTTDGLEAIAAIRQAGPAVRIVAISGGGRVRNLKLLEMAQRVGADATLSKPFSVRELVGCLENCIEASVDENDPPAARRTGSSECNQPR